MFIKGSLTLYHTIPTFNNPKEEAFGKHCGKRRKCWKPAFSPFPTVFSTLEQSKIIILTMFNLSSANAFTMVTSKSLSFGKGLIRVVKTWNHVVKMVTLPHKPDSGFSNSAANKDMSKLWVNGVQLSD